VNLVRRGVATDAASAAIAMTAALRSLEAAGVDPPAVWIAHGTARFDASAAWDHGIALVRVAGADAEASAVAVAEAVVARIVRSAADLGRLGDGRGDGARLAARHELGLWPDEHVVAVLHADGDPAALQARLEAFDRALAEEPATARRLILADLVGHGPALSAPMLAAILHPLVLVEVRRDQVTLELLRYAADEVVETGPAVRHRRAGRR
jgi:hypothetical protein